MAGPVHERLLRSTVALLSSRGVAGTGISELLSHSKASRRSVYLHFPAGKGELVKAATEFAGAKIGKLIDGAGDDRPPAHLIHDFVQFWSTQIRLTGFDSGCPIVAAALGHHEAPDAAAAAGNVFEVWVSILGDNFRRWSVDEQAARAAATVVVAGIEGAVIMSLAQRNTRPLDLVGDHLTRYVDTLTGARSAAD